MWGFAVSLVEEGVELRRGGVEAPILVLGSPYGLAHRDVHRLSAHAGASATTATLARASRRAADELWQS